MINTFDITCHFIHDFDIVVPNFSSVKTVTCKIDYEDYILKTTPIIVESIGKEFYIKSSLSIKMDVSELVNCPIDINTDDTIEIDDSKISMLGNFDVAVNINDTISSIPSLIELSNVDIKDGTILELEPSVGVLVKLGELDPLTLGDIDNKTLEQLSYKIK